MKWRFWNLSIAWICMTGVGAIGQPLPDIHPSVIDELQIHDTVSTLLILRDQGEKLLTSEMTTKEEKALMVHAALSELSRWSQADLLDSLEGWGIDSRPFYIVNAVQARIDSVALKRLSHRTDLRSILPDFPMSMPSPEKSPIIILRQNELLHWGIRQIQADSVWKSGITGRNVVVAGLDTGVEWDHDFLKSQYRGYKSGEDVDHNYNWYDAVIALNRLNRDSFPDPENNPCGLQSLIPCDDHGHGTFTMGLMTGGYQDQFTGIAPGSQWIGVRVMERGNGTISTYLGGLEWCLAPTNTLGEKARPEWGPDIINNSWACPHREGCIAENYWVLDSAFSKLEQAGIFLVAAAGNTGRDGCSSIDTPPALFRNAFTVGASDRNDSIADFSSRGPLSLDGLVKPEVVAPGVGITSLYPGGQFRTSNGTSASAPLVAGVAALVLEANPSLRGKPGLIREILINSTIPIADNPCGVSESPNHVYGYGRVNAFSAVKYAMEYQPTSTVESNADLDFHFFPNPVDQFMFIENNTSYSSMVGLFNMQGQFLREILLPMHTTVRFSVLDLKSGLYFARITTQKGVIVRKFIRL